MFFKTHKFQIGQDTLLHSGLQAVHGYTIAASLSTMMEHEEQLWKYIAGLIFELSLKKSVFIAARIYGG